MGTETKMSRRRFLAVAGGVVGASVLACSGLTALAVHQPAVDYPETSCTAGEAMKKKVLVAYASRAGSTGGVAEAIAKTLCENGASVDVRLAKDVSDVSAYQAVVVGSAIYMGQWMGEAVEFVEKNRAALGQRPTAYFCVCSTLREDTPENRRTVTAYLDGVRAKVQPVSEGLFAGALDYSKQSFLYRMIVKAMKASEGDWRNWDAIRAWSKELVPALEIG